MDYNDYIINLINKHMNKSIKVTHRGDDYYKIEINGKEYEVSMAVGKYIAKSINAIISIVKSY